MLGKYAKILYAEACLISGVSLDNPAELCELVSELMI
jgi:HSP90 family molecular chaperone